MWIRRLHSVQRIAKNAKQANAVDVCFLMDDKKFNEQYPDLLPISNALQKEVDKLKSMESLTIRLEEKDEIRQSILVDVGVAEKLNDGELRNAVNSAMVVAKKEAKDRPIVFHVPAKEVLVKSKIASTARCMELMTQVSLLSGYTFTKYLTKNAADVQPILLCSEHEDEKLLEEANVLASETIRARNLGSLCWDAYCTYCWLGNERADVANPEYVEQLARDVADEFDSVNVKVLDHEKLKEQGLNMLYAVGQAATSLPQLVLLEYDGRKDTTSNEKTVALVGKGVTFDTGGLNLKPTGYIENMHMDMCGAAAVLGTIRAAAKLGLEKKIVVALALAENAIDAKSYKPHAILKSHKGLTVEVNNTDAEGRLCLADAMSYVQQEYSPSTLIDVATLTGACVVALGECAAGVFSNDRALTKSILDAGENCGERCWELPILPEHSKELKGLYSDSRSTGKGREGGASTAAAFLKQFVNEDVQWAHIDIAGPAMYSTTRSYMPQGATGFGVQLLFKYLQADK